MVSLGSEYYPESYLSPRARKLFDNCNQVEEPSDERSCPCVTCDGFIVMEHVALHLGNSVDNEDYLSAVQSIAHTMQLCQRNFCLDAFHYSSHCLKWLSTPLHFVRLRNTDQNRSTLDRLLAMLQVISMLEFSISRLLADEGHRSPTHLTAALKDDRLAKFLSAPTLSVLKILFGPVNSLNLRNIFWDGFVTLSDIELNIPECLLYFLFAVILSIDEQLTGNLDAYVIGESKLSQCFKVLTEELLPDDNCMPVLNEPKGIRIDLLKSFVELLVHRRYNDAICIGVLCITHVLRNEFCRSINWPEGVYTSENRSFLTLNGILKMQLFKSSLQPVAMEKWKHFEQRIGSTNLLLFDGVFSAKEGPQLRDRLAHGELFETSIADSVMWEGLARRLRFCVFLLLNHLRSGNIPVILRKLDVRPDTFNPFSQYAVYACELWSTWAAFFRMTSEVASVRRLRPGLFNAARKWFPQLPASYDASLHSFEDASEFLPSVDVSRLWILKAHYMTKSEKQTLSKHRYEGKQNPFKTAQWLVRVVQNLNDCLKLFFDRFCQDCSKMEGNMRILKENVISAVKRFTQLIVPELLAVTSILVLCCCHKEGIWKTWFSGSFIANESAEVRGANIPSDFHVLVCSFAIFESKITSALKNNDDLRIESILGSFKFPYPKSDAV